MRNLEEPMCRVVTTWALTEFVCLRGREIVVFGDIKWRRRDHNFRDFRNDGPSVNESEICR